jgi:hypothetical protein
MATRRHTLAAAALSILALGAVEANAASVVLDFEAGGLGYTPADNAAVEANTFDAYNIRIVGDQTDLAFEARGEEGPNDHDGFVNDPARQNDTERPSAAGGLGSFFLRQVATLGTTQDFDPTKPIFSIAFSRPQLKTP